MITYTGRLRIRDEHGLYTTKEVKVGVNEATYTTPEAQYGAAVDMLADFATAFDNIIDGVITDLKVTGDILAEATGLKTVAGDQGVAEGANLSMWVDAEKTIPYFVPSAKQGIFLADFRTVDTADAELAAFMSLISGNTSDNQFEFSDGELVNDTLGASGLKSGYYGTRARSGKE